MASRSAATDHRHALVIGASMGGLLAARALTAHFDRVTVIDRDEIPHEPVTRGGVPQGRHTHGMLARGREVIEELFPGTTSDLQARGALVGDAQADGNYTFEGQHLAAGDSGLQLLAVSRPLLEWYLRQRLLAFTQIDILPATSVLDLSFTADDSRVNGVLVTDRDADTPRLLPGDLVVDASGRTSRTPEWLERRGYPAPPEDVRRIDKHYATRLFRRTTDGPPWLAIAVGATAAIQRGGIMLAQEGGRWTVSLSGRHGDRPPTDLAGFLAYARTFASPAIADALDGLVPLDEGMVYRFPANRRRHYERLTEFPDGLVAIGDALCAFDPVYGQGMTVAALEAQELGRCLTEGRLGLARRYHAAAKTHIATPWTIAVGATPPMPGSEAEQQPLGTRLVNTYLRQVLAAGRTDATVAGAFLRVNNLAARPTDLMHPKILLRVARQAIGSHQPEPSRHVVPLEA